MDLTEFCETYGQVISSLRSRLGDDECDDLLTYLDTGEEGLAVEFLVNRLVLGRIAVARAEADTLLQLMRWFELSPSDPEADGFYAALADPDRAVAELTVVDEPSS